MRVVEEIRRARLLELKEEVGSWVAMGKLLNLGPRDSTLSQIATEAPNTSTGKPRQMGSDLARRIEVAFKKPPGWMDNDPAPSMFSAALHKRLMKLTPGELVKVERHIWAGLELLAPEEVPSSATTVAVAFVATAPNEPPSSTTLRAA